MICPKCKVEMDKVSNYYGANGGAMQVETPFVKCPKCKKEMEHKDEKED